MMEDQLLLEDNNTCSVCLSLLDDPRTLACSHNLCFKCAVSIYSSQQLKSTTTITSPPPPSPLHENTKNNSTTTPPRGIRTGSRLAPIVIGSKSVERKSDNNNSSDSIPPPIP